MCGLAGFVDRASRITDHAAVLTAMSRAVAHRGPDGHGEFVEPRLGLGIAHRRLAILDRTESAAQPMHSPDGRWVVAYNGELWNHAELRHELVAAGHPVGASTGDTTVLCAMLAARGLDATLAVLDGMFAFVAVDLHERTLWLARDRFGVKPCFWGWAEDGRGPGVFVFASEIRALTACPTFRNAVSPFAVAQVLASLTARGTRTVYEGVHPVEPGGLVGLDLSTGRTWRHRWFDLRAAARAARARGLLTDRAAMLGAFDGLLDAAVRLRLQSDVPVGAFLSGGIDSSLVVAAMHRAGVAPLATFTVGFEDPNYDERPYARALAAHFGTEHHEVSVADADLPALVEDAIACFDEPFADSSAVATLAVSRAARGRVGVVLSGEGGDELFGGYDRQFRAWTVRQWSRRVPAAARARLADALEAVGADAWERTLAPLEFALPAGLQRAQRGRLVHKLAGILRAEDDEALWRSFFRVWPNPDAAIPRLPSDLWAATERRDARALGGAFPDDADGFFDEMLLRDQCEYLPSDLLVKLDRCSMECGLEAREPLLDMRLFEFAWRIPPAWRTQGSLGKALLRRSLAARLPKGAAPALSARPKQGFGVPLRAWLCGPLARWADGVLDPRRINAQGILDGRAAAHALARARAGDEGAAQRAWAACVVSRWFEREGIDGSRLTRVGGVTLPP